MELIKAALAVTAVAFLLSMPASAQELTGNPNQSTAPKSWEIVITSSGGIHGLGDGGITIQSNGEARVYDLNKSCNLQIPSETFQDLERSFNGWESNFRSTLTTDSKKISSQTASGPISVGSDMIKYSMRIKSGGVGLVDLQYFESWVKYLDRDTPESLHPVRRMSLQLRDSLLTKCK